MKPSPLPTLATGHTSQVTRPWAMETRALATFFQSFADARARIGEHVSARARTASAAWTLDEWRAAVSEFVVQRQSTALDPTSGLASMDLRGVLLDSEAPAWVAMLGGTLYPEIRAEIATLRSRAVSGVLITCDSPGGSAIGCAEAAADIAALAKEVPVIVHVSGLCASAAYALAAGATEIWADPSSLSGCIGTIIPLLDWSGMWEEMGVKDDYITNTGGDLKAAGRPPSQTPEERAALQQEVDDLYAQFRDHVLAHRNVAPDAMRGQCLVGPRALEANLVDHLGSRAEALARLQSIAL